MKTKLKIVLIHSIFVFFFNDQISAQVSYGGEPYSFTNTNSAIKRTKSGSIQVNSYKVKDINIEDINKELDSLNLCKECNNGFYYGKEIDTQINFFKSAQSFEVAENEKIWILKIESDKAEGYQFIFNSFYLDKNAKLFIYNEDKSMLLGSFTSENNRVDSTFLTQYINGKNIYIEYIGTSESETSNFFIDKIVYIFNPCFSENKGPFSKESSAACHINTACVAGQGFDVEIKSTVMILRKENNNYWGNCSGVLVNDGVNYSVSKKPYIFSSNHCYEDKDGKLSNLNDWLFLFRHEATSCDSDGSDVSNNTTKSALGATVLSRDEQSKRSDYLLLQLNNSVVDISQYDIVFAGCDLDESFITPGTFGFPSVGVHHPKGDVKKIFISEEEAQSTGWNKPGNDHWKVLATKGFKVEPASSGSPLFNSDHQVIGVCHGGDDKITCNSDDEKFRHSVYGKLSDANINNKLMKHFTGTKIIPYYPPNPSVNCKDLSIVIDDAINRIEDQKSTVEIGIRGGTTADSELVSIELIINKQPFDNEIFDPSNGEHYYKFYYENQYETLVYYYNNISRATANFDLPAFTKPGEYEAIIQASRACSGFSKVNTKKFKIIVTSPGTCTCGRIDLQIMGDQEKYAPGSVITAKESTEVFNEKTPILFPKNSASSLLETPCDKVLGECGLYVIPQFYGITKRIWNFNDITISSDDYNTAIEYIETNPGIYYEPSMKNIELNNPGIYKLKVQMNLSRGYYNSSLCDPKANTLLKPANNIPSEILHASKTIIVADCAGYKYINKIDHPLLSIKSSDEKDIGAGTIEIQNIVFDTNKEYAVEAYKSIRLKKGIHIKKGTTFRAKITPCPEVTQAKLYESKAATDINNVSDFTSKITIYPNPCYGIINIKATDGVNINSTEIYDINGILKYRNSIINIYELDISFLEDGMYVLKVSSDLGVSTHKVVLRK